MNNILKFLCVTLTLAITACATPGDGAKWECTAKNIVNSYYTGSNFANIHLQGYNSGGDYPVKLNEQRTEATGITGDGTPFKCTKIK